MTRKITLIIASISILAVSLCSEALAGSTQIKNNTKSYIVKSIVEDLKQYRQESLQKSMNEYRQMLFIGKEALLNSEAIKNVYAANDFVKMSL